MKLNTYMVALATMLLFLPGVNAQNNLILEINHHLNEAAFAFNTESTNPEGVKFNVERLEYYISEININYHNGQTMQFDSLWVLVDASQTTEIDLGSHLIDSVESVAFSVGVNAEVNHLDPASWPNQHPLAPKNPSMHWGWASGYRFVAMEGKGGNDLIQTYEIHALDDINYFETSVDVNAMASGGELKMVVYGNYSMALKGIDVSSGVISHGASNQSEDLLKNFRDDVFGPQQPEDSTTSVAATKEILPIKVAPNPATNGLVNLTMHNIDPTTIALQVVDLSGRLVDVSRNNGGQVIQLSGLEAGIYLIHVADKKTGGVSQFKVSVL